MIALLFSLLALALILAWRNSPKASYLVFTATMVLSIYWLSYHATDSLGISL